MNKMNTREYECEVDEEMLALSDVVFFKSLLCRHHLLPSTDNNHTLNHNHHNHSSSIGIGNDNGNDTHVDDDIIDYFMRGFRSKELMKDELYELFVGMFPEVLDRDFATNDAREGEESHGIWENIWKELGTMTQKSSIATIGSLSSIDNTSSSSSVSSPLLSSTIQSSSSHVAINHKKKAAKSKKAESTQSFVGSSAATISKATKSSLSGYSSSSSSSIVSNNPHPIHSLEYKLTQLLHQSQQPLLGEIIIDETVIAYLKELRVDLSEDDNDSFGEVIGSYYPPLMMPEHVSTLQSFMDLIRNDAAVQDNSSSLPTTSNPIADAIAIAMESSSAAMKSLDVDQEPETICDSNEEMLLSVFPTLDPKLVKFVYVVKNAKNTQEAAKDLGMALDSIEALASLEEELKFHEQRQAAVASEEAERNKRARELAVKRFSEKEVLPTFDKNGKEIKRPAIVFMSTVGGGNQKIRYRDGVIVTHKGEKVIVEKNPADDYDGGSRGRVKTKRKGGVGWV